MKLYESRLSYFHDKATINHCKPLSVHQHGAPLRLRHVETQTMQTADCADRVDCADWVLFFYLIF